MATKAEKATSLPENSIHEKTPLVERVFFIVVAKSSQTGCFIRIFAKLFPMKKKILLLSIIIFPSLLYFFFELTQANFKKMPYFGPKTVTENGDTSYYRLPEFYFRLKNNDSLMLDTATFPVYAILFIDKQLKKEGYKLPAIYDYIKYKSKDIQQVPIVVVTDYRESLNNNSEFDSLQLGLPNFHSVMLDLSNRQAVLTNSYFNQKPVHVFDYFLVLVDKKRHIRGYYDPSYNAEVKRMIDEYKHLKIRDEYAETLKQNDIRQNEK